MASIIERSAPIFPCFSVIIDFFAVFTYFTAGDPAPVDQSARRSCRTADPSVHRRGSHSPSTPRPSISQPAIPRPWICPPAGLADLPIPPSIDGDHTVHRRRGHLFHSLQSRAHGSGRPPVLQICRPHNLPPPQILDARHARSNVHDTQEDQLKKQRRGACRRFLFCGKHLCSVRPSWADSNGWKSRVSVGNDETHS